MTTAKHTPGPWTVMEPRKVGGALGDSGDRGIDAGGVAIGEAWEHCPMRGNPDGTRVDAAANARLIAAAPELLEALGTLLHTLTEDVSDYERVTAIEAAEAAYAKATAP